MPPRRYLCSPEKYQPDETKQIQERAAGGELVPATLGRALRPGKQQENRENIVVKETGRAEQYCPVYI